VTLVLRPPGRGNWTRVVIVIDQSRHSPLPLFFAKGERITLGGRVLRVCEVWE